MTKQKTIDEVLRDQPATVDDLIATLDRLCESLRTEPEGWENPTLERYLDAMRAWITAMKRPIGSEPSWRLFIEMLEAGKLYE